jgi:nitrite reductase (NADH) small subunit
MQPADAPLNWFDAAAETDLPPGARRALETPAGRIVLFHTQGGRLFALTNRCPHFGAPLSAGKLEEACVTCAFHGWQVDLATGEARAPGQQGPLPPAQQRVATYPVKREGGRVWIGLGTGAIRP